MSHGVFAPLEEAIESATRTLQRLHAELARLREEKTELAAEVERLQGGVVEGGADDERVEALVRERQLVRKRLRALLERISEVDVGE